MISKVLSLCAAALLIGGVANPVFADEHDKEKRVQSPSIEGTYKLVSRKLPDGITLSGRDVIGLLTFTKTHRNFNIAWKDSTGKHWSYSVVSTYTLTSTEYTETILVSIMNDEIGGEGTTYTMSGSPRTVPVKMDGGRIEFRMPFDPVSAVFDGHKFTGTNDGVFVDSWEKVQ